MTDDEALAGDYLKGDAVRSGAESCCMRRNPSEGSSDLRSVAEWPVDWGVETSVGLGVGAECSTGAG